MTHTDEVEHLYEGSHKKFAQIHREAALKQCLLRIKKAYKFHTKQNPGFTTLQVIARSFGESLVLQSLGFENNGQAVNLFAAGNSFVMVSPRADVDKLLETVDKAKQRR